jgi:predicted thioesterase
MRHVVTHDDTAIAMGSGDVSVLATPRLLAWLEGATVRGSAPFVEPTSTTVGVRAAIEHLKAVPVGDTVVVEAEPPAQDGRRLVFAVRAVDEAGEVVARGEVVRVVVDRARFVH